MTTGLRIQRTLYMIHTSFISLLQTHEFEQISVLMLCEKAMINPKTFYKYYAGKSALAGALIKQFKHELAQLQHERLTTPNPKQFLQIASQFFFDKRLMLLALWKINTKRHHLWQDMHEMIKITYMKKAQMHNPSIDTEMLHFQAHIFSVMLMNAIQYQLEHNKMIESEQMFAQFEQITHLIQE